jgi:hypothetical protein
MIGKLLPSGSRRGGLDESFHIDMDETMVIPKEVAESCLPGAGDAGK